MPKTTAQPNLETLRHSAAHVLAAAVLEMFPEAKLGTGPATDSGFYYDFELPRTLIPEDLKLIEKKMKHIVKQNQKFEHSQKPIEQARAFFKKIKQNFKLEIVNELEKQGESEVSFYKNGNYVDLCTGPHLDSTGQLKAFKLTHFSSSYWRGDAERPSLQRIYGVAFQTADDLKAWEELQIEAKKRDHRKLGAELGLFTFSEQVGSGLPLFTPKGAFIRDKIADTIQEIQAKYGFEKVWIPHITKKDLYETSGHWEKFKDDLFHVRGKSDTEFVMKPMNCPHHTQIYAASAKSYRDLPVRYAEVTTCYRDEQPGELLGLSRVRSLTQDDGHIFCRPDQIKEECRNIVHVIREFYTKLDMFKEGDFWISLSVRDPATPEKYLGDAKNWDAAEQYLQEVAEEEKLNAKRVEGEAAFYGPKLDFQFKDALGRQWQLATIQLDFVQPARFKLEYTNEKGVAETPVMIHRAVAGSLERFLAVLIEHFAGQFPVWLAPEQARFVPVATDFIPVCEEMAAELKKTGARVTVDTSSDSLGKKVRNGEKAKLPYLLVVGEKEAKAKSVTIRERGVEKQETLKLAAFTKKLG